FAEMYQWVRDKKQGQVTEYFSHDWPFSAQELQLLLEAYALLYKDNRPYGGRKITSRKKAITDDLPPIEVRRELARVKKKPQKKAQ
ncbi:MAG: hypothetical protein AAGA45_07585, partial [Verrucomicrobiota bacterium]